MFRFQNWYCSSFLVLISLYTSVYVVSRTLTTTLAIAAAFLPGNGQNATNNVYETAILDHLGPIAQRDWCIFDDDGQADNKTRGCRSDHYFSQDLNQGGVLGVLSATHCAPWSQKRKNRLGWSVCLPWLKQFLHQFMYIPMMTARPEMAPPPFIITYVVPWLVRRSGSEKAAIVQWKMAIIFHYTKYILMRFEVIYFYIAAFF